MKTKLQIDWPAVKVAARTSGALMIGNVFINALVLGNRHWPELVALLVLGAAVIIVASIVRKE